MKKRCVIFDLDGTLADTIPDIASAMNAALAEAGFDTIAEEAYAPMVGWGLKTLARLALPEEARDEKTVQRVTSLAGAYYAGHPLVRTRAYPGMTEVVRRLAAGKILTAVLTNKPAETARAVVEGLFPPSSFAVVRGAVSGVPLKPDPQAVWDILIELGLVPADAVLVGDSEIDMETARAALCFPLGVSWGYRPRDVLEKAGAAFIACEPRSLLSFLTGTDSV